MLLNTEKVNMSIKYSTFYIRSNCMKQSKKPWLQF